ncbi:hypothetical protein CORMATOL_02220 [Corynebacterium matruchotii ATCC 33806]|uniref:Uncharacterized protein n=1 Tax=Corynebacterium matruchotii ATCC 33806 TaxID=566549 RepID=C0E5E3_9CORY|nr:hypothetical protein CORMATOL_02220 [Corynebacterium matruchotii ATCC 33806]
MVLLCGVAGMRHADAGGFGKNLRTWVPTSNLVPRRSCDTVNTTTTIVT